MKPKPAAGKQRSLLNDVAEASVEIGHRLFPGEFVRILEPKVSLESTSAEVKVLQEKVLYSIQKVPYNEERQPLYRLQILIQLGI